MINCVTMETYVSTIRMITTPGSVEDDTIAEVVKAFSRLIAVC